MNEEQIYCLYEWYCENQDDFYNENYEQCYGCNNFFIDENDEEEIK